MAPRPLFPKKRTPRPPVEPNAERDRTAPLTGAETARLRAAMVAGREAVECPRCGSSERVAPPVRNEATGASLWVVYCRVCRRRVTIRAYPSGHLHAPQFDRLVASGPLDVPDRRSFLAGIGGGVIPIALVAVAALATDRPAATVEYETEIDTSMVILVPPGQQPEQTPKVDRDERAAPPSPPAPVPPPISVVVPIDVPVDVPIDLPDAADDGGFDPRRFGRYEPDGSTVNGASSPIDERGDGETKKTLVFRIESVDEPPVYLSGPPLRYPRLLSQQRVEGHVVLRFVVDETGRPDSSTIAVSFASHSGFVASAVAVVAGSVFRPARLRGAAVPVFVEQRVEFTLAARPE